MLSKNVKAYRSRIINFPDTTEGHGFKHSSNTDFQLFEDGVLLVEDGKIQSLNHAQVLADQGLDLDQCEHYPNHLLCPGFIDAHVHAPQQDVIGSYGSQLMDWLEKYTFPAEQEYSNEMFSRNETQRFISSLLENGTTSGLIFTTSYKHNTEHVFKEAQRLNMRIIAGKVMMDRHAPKQLLDTAQSSFVDSEALIKNWHNNGRLGYALTPRFAGTSTIEQLSAAGSLLKKYPDVWLQTHLSENLDEIRWTEELFPEAKNYFDVYDKFHLVGPRSIFAHCIHLDENERSRFANSGSVAAFCPSSNLFLGSGLFDLADFKSRNIPVALASDVGAGTSISMFKTMGDAYKVCQLKSLSLTAIEAFYLCTLGSARALKIDKHIGSLCTNKEADFIFINPANHKPIQNRLKRCTTIEEELFVYMTMGDERLIDRTYIAGALQYQNTLNEDRHN